MATAFAESFRADPMGPIGWTIEVLLRIGPPRAPEMSSKGNVPSLVYKALDTSCRQGQLRPSYPKFGEPRAELPIPLDSGILHDLAIVTFGGDQGGWTITGLVVDAAVLSKDGMRAKLEVAAGVAPVPLGGEGSQMNT